MARYCLKRNNNSYLLKTKFELFDNNNFSYTTSGNDITITKYNGNATDVIITNMIIDTYSLNLKRYKMNVSDYEYSVDNEEVELINYIGSGGNIEAPILESE